MKSNSSGSLSIASIRKLLPRSGSVKHKMTSNPKLSRFNTENVPPMDSNIPIDELPEVSVSGKEIIEIETEQHEEVPLSVDPHVKVYEFNY